MYFFNFLILINYNQSFASDKCEIRQSPTQSLTSSSVDILKQTEINFVQQNTAEFCRRNMLLRYLRACRNGTYDRIMYTDIKCKPPSEYENLPTDKLEAEVDRVNIESSPWQLSLVSTEKSKKAGADRQIPRGGSAQSFFSKSSKPLDVNVYQQINNYIDKAEVNPAIANQVTPTVIKAACLYESPTHFLSCNKALDSALDKMLPKGKETIMDRKVWKNVLGSSRYDEGIRKAALVMAEKIQDPGKIGNANVFEDIQKSFLSSGMSSLEAEEATWDTLALIGNHGPNIASYTSRITEKFQIPDERGFAGDTQKTTALGYIASAMTYLDLKQVKVGKKMYSYPSQVQSTCDNSKPYHFWVSAYIARSLVKEHGIPPESASEATYFTEKAYQLNRHSIWDSDVSNSTNNAYVSRLSSSKNFSPTNQVIRTDLAYAAVGSNYGADSAKMQTPVKSYNVDRALLNLMKDSGTSSYYEDYLPANKATLFLQWNHTFSPNSAMESQ